MVPLWHHSEEPSSVPDLLVSVCRHGRIPELLKGHILSLCTIFPLCYYDSDPQIV